MPRITIWTLESDYDADAVKWLANKLVSHRQLENMRIRTVGKRAVPRRKGSLKSAVRNYLKEDACVIFVLDTDGSMSSYQRRQEPNSLINQVERVAEDKDFAGKVCLAWAKQELEAWLLIDCLGIFCYFASQRRQFKQNSRERVESNPDFSSIVKKHQPGNTELIVEAVSGGSGVKEYLVDYSKEILLALNPKMPQRNVKDQRYRERMSPGIAEHIVINDETLRRNNSLKHLGALLARFK